MKILLFLSMFVLSFSIISCRAIGVEAEKKLGITAKEVFQRSAIAMDPNSVFTQSKSFKLTQTVTSQNREYVYESILQVKAANIMRIDTFQNGLRFNTLILNGDEGWELDPLGKTRVINELTLAFIQIRMTSSIDDLKNRRIKKLELEESDINPENWYKLVFYPTNPKLYPIIRYIDKKNFLTQRTITYMPTKNGRFIRQTIDCIEYRFVGDAYLLTKAKETDQTGNESLIDFKSIEFDIPLEDSLFELDPYERLQIEKQKELDQLSRPIPEPEEQSDIDSDITKIRN